MKKNFLVLIVLCLFAVLIVACSKEKKEATSNADLQKSVTVNTQAIEIQKPHPKEILQPNPPTRKPKAMTLLSSLVSKAPTIDGNGSEEVWRSAEAISTLDYISGRSVEIKSVHTKDRIYFLVRFPDVSPSTTHKSFGWDYHDKVYEQLNDREDVFVFKWSLMGNDIDLSFSNPEPHQADVWFWKAKRTDPSGYSDDKIQTLQTVDNIELKKIPIPNKKGKFLYLERKGDTGKSAYHQEMIFEYQGDVKSQFFAVQPSGSRADVRAKGVWKEGFWTIEFARKLDTGYPDDIQFKSGQVYLFGVATSELAFDDVHSEFSVPLFRSGDVFDRLFLQIK